MKTTNEISRKNSGITLIALIITIIVMLILVAVTVTMAVNGGLFEKAASAGRQTNEERDRELEIAKGETIQDLINKYTTSTGVDSDEEDDENLPTSPYVGCYADLDGNGEIETDKDGIIYADLGVGNTKGRRWGSSRFDGGDYTIPVETNLKEYNLSDETVNGAFGERKVVTLAEEDETKNERFYVMALTDFTTDEYEVFYWNESDNEIEFGISDIFGTGAENTKLLIEYWENNEDIKWTDQDIWKNLTGLDGWFVPSSAEFAAFMGELGLSNVYSDFGVSDDYWTSSQDDVNEAWAAILYQGWMCGNVFDNNHFIRLSTTF